MVLALQLPGYIAEGVETGTGNCSHSGEEQTGSHHLQAAQTGKGYLPLCRNSG